jgi:hypothetical protein
MYGIDDQCDNLRGWSLHMMNIEYVQGIFHVINNGRDVFTDGKRLPSPWSIEVLHVHRARRMAECTQYIQQGDLGTGGIPASLMRIGASHMHETPWKPSAISHPLYT